MAFNNWPYTNFQDLNLWWILNKVKEALFSSAAAMAKAEAVESEVGTYSQRISDAETAANSAGDIANAAQGTANSALSAANSAQDSADEADSKAETALNDYLDVHITAYENDPFQTDKNVDDILTAVSANKKIRFTLDDTRNGDAYVTFDYQIVTVEDSATDVDIQVYFDTSVSNTILKFFLVTLTKRVGSDSSITYSTVGGDVTFSGGGGGGVTDAVLYVAQALTTAQKGQARSNISAGHFNIGIDTDETLITITDLVNETVSTYRINKPPYQIPVNYINGVYVTSATGENVFDNITDCVIIFNGAHYYQIGSTLSGAFGHAYFACIDPSASGKYDVDIFDVELNGTNACTVAKYDKDINLLPGVSSADVGKFLRVNSSGSWVAETVPSAESNSFGGV